MAEAKCPLFPMKRDYPLDPPPQYAEFRRGDPPVVRARLWNGTTTWLVTKYDDVRHVLEDSEKFSTVPTQPGYPMIAPGRAEFLLKERPTFIRMDPPEHTRLRRMITKQFMVKRIQKLRPTLERTVDELLDDMERHGSPVDLVTTFALPLPTLIVSELLGIPYEDHEFIQERTSTKLNLEAPSEVPIKAQNDILDYLDRLMKEKEVEPEPGDGVLDRLVVEQVLPGNLSHEDAVAMAEMLIVAGHETTANAISLGTLTFFENPDQLERLRRDPSLVGNAVEEILRYLTITHLNGARVALQDVEIGGQEIKAGEGVWALLSSANRDEDRFPNSDRFDITRDASGHATFGFGVHQCLGQGLARMELEVAFDRLLKRFPSLRLAVPFEEVPFKYEAFVFGVKSLEVAW